MDPAEPGIAAPERFPDGVTAAPLHPEVVSVREHRRSREDRESTRHMVRRGTAGILDVAAAVGAAVLAVSLATWIFGLVPEQRPLIGLVAAALVDLGLPMRPGRHRGQTAGKQIVGLRTRRVDGDPLTAGRMVQLSLLRWLSQGLRLWTYWSYDRSTGTEVVDARNPPPVRPLRGAALTLPDDRSATRATSSRKDR